MKRSALYSIAVLLLITLTWVGCGTDWPLTPSNDQAIGVAPKPTAVAAVTAVQNRHTDRLLAIPGVVGTATGLAPDGSLVIKVLTEAAGIAGIPTSLEGVSVLVEVTGKIVALGPPVGAGGVTKIDPKKRFPRPVPIGVSTGNEGECSAGTIGARVTDDTNVYALSNNHVYALENKASIGSDVLQPGRYDTNCNIDPNDIIGTLHDFEPIKFDGSDNTIDAAIALSSTTNLGKATPTNGYGTPQSVTVPASLNQKVQKYGRTTSLTKGVVTGINATVNVGYSSGTAKFVDQIIVQSTKPFIRAGDSGSLGVTDSNRNPVGLLFAGTIDGKLGVANKIDLVLARFNVTVDGE